MKIIVPFVILFLTSSTTLLMSQEKEENWYTNKPIYDIRFEGLYSVQKSELEGITRPFLGKPLTEDNLQKLQNSLYSLDYFQGLIELRAAKADFAGSKVLVIAKVIEKPLIDLIELRGNFYFSSSELENIIASKRDRIIEIAKIKQDEMKLKDHYLEKGFQDIEVTSEIKTISDHKVNVIFTLQEGQQTTIKNIEFKDNSFASASTLKGIMETKEQGFFNPGFFKETTFLKDQRSIENYYWNHGYIDARVVGVEKDILFDQDSKRHIIQLVIFLNEGEPYVFAGFTFVGNKMFSDEMLQSQVKHKTEELINKEKVEADYDRIRNLYYDNGYTFNQIIKKEKREGNAVSYIIEIEERPRAHIENIIIAGNSRTEEQVIRRELPLEEGDTFSRSKLINGLMNLYNLQYFSTVNPTIKPGSKEGLVDLLLTVEEGRTSNIQMALNFGTQQDEDWPIGLNLVYAEKNFLGKGFNFSGDLFLAASKQGLTLGFMEPWFLNQRLSIGADLGVSHSLLRDEAQDILSPIYNNQLNDIQDPYRADDWIFLQDTTYNGVAYKKGQSFPGVPTDSDKASYHLLSRYDYDYTRNSSLSPIVPMRYSMFAVDLFFKTGYAWFTPIGRWHVDGSAGTVLKRVFYDEKIFRPANTLLRNNSDSWFFHNKIRIGGLWDTRDLIQEPSNGYSVSQTITLNGGFLSGTTHYSRFETNASAYFKLFGINLSDSYEMSLILKLFTGFKALTKALGGPEAPIMLATERIYIDGMNTNRGWGLQKDGKVSWTSTIELRMPLIKNWITWDAFFVDHAVLININAQQNMLWEMPLSAHLFSFGTGLRIANSMLPLGIYFAMPFSFDEQNRLAWHPDGISQSPLRIVLAIKIER